MFWRFGLLILCAPLVCGPREWPSPFTEAGGRKETGPPMLGWDAEWGIIGFPGPLTGPF